MARKKSTSAQMEMFQDGGLKDQGEMVDPVTNNPVPIGSTKKEVRDDIPANLSEGEFVLPADVVRYHGLEKIMGFRDQAKDGLQKMEQMGQMGNSDEATVPDGVPFKQMAVGGNVGGTPTIQQPTIVQPTIQPNPVQGTQTVAAQNPALRQSIYAQPQQPIQQPIQRPIVGIPGMPVYGQQGPQYKQPTDTANTPPNYSDIIGSPFGQLQKSETRKYVNEEGLELYIPFVNGEPLYPIPNGYKYTEVIGKEKEKEEVTGAVKTTQTRTPDSSGDDGGSQDPDTKEYKVASQLMADDAAIKGGFLQDLTKTLGKLSTLSPVGMFVEKFKGPPEMRPGYGLAEAFESDRTVGGQKNKDSIARGMGYISYQDIVDSIGVNPSFKLGTKPGDVSMQTGKMYNYAGQSTGNDGSVAYSSYTDFTNAMAASSATGWYGGTMTEKEIQNAIDNAAKKGNTWNRDKIDAYNKVIDTKYGKKKEEPKVEVTKPDVPADNISDISYGDGPTGDPDDDDSVDNDSGYTAPSPSDPEMPTQRDPDDDYDDTNYNDNNNNNNDNNDNGDSGSDGSGDSHICTATYNNGYIDKEHFTTLRKYGILLRRNDPYMMKAYDMFGPTLASYVHKNKYMTSFAKFITQYYKDTMDNRQLSIRQNIFKFISNNILRPTYRIVGWTAVKLSK